MLRVSRSTSNYLRSNIRVSTETGQCVFSKRPLSLQATDGGLATLDNQTKPLSILNIGRAVHFQNETSATNSNALTGTPVEASTNKLKVELVQAVIRLREANRNGEKPLYQNDSNSKASIFFQNGSSQLTPQQQLEQQGQVIDFNPITNPTDVSQQSDTQPTLADRQRQREHEHYRSALKEQEDIFFTLRTMGKGASLKKVQQDIVQWYEPVTKALEKEIHEILNNKGGIDRTLYGPYLLMLPVDKLAIVALSTTMNAILRLANEGVPLMPLLLEIGSSVETEVELAALLSSKDEKVRHMKQLMQKAMANSNLSDAKRILRKYKKLVMEEEGWPKEIRVKVGAVLLMHVINSVKTHTNRPVFFKDYSYNKSKITRIAMLKMAPSVYQHLDGNMEHLVFPRFRPMLVPPNPWNNQQFRGAYLQLRAPLMKNLRRMQTEAVKRAKMEPVLEGLDYIGQIPWVINSEMLNVVEEVRKRGYVIGEVVEKDNLPIQEREAFEEACNKDPSLMRYRNLVAVEGDKPERVKYVRDLAYQGVVEKIKKRNNELHSLRCDLNIKVSIAKELEKDIFYFPYQLDFRGRAYPIPPNLNHLGADLSRSLFLFSEGKKLGENGYKWLHVHLANICGYNKVTFEERVQWTQQHLPQIRESVQDPFAGEMLWSKQENPYQALATGRELLNAMKLDDPTEYVCRLPLHQDGSCNGLQHYASLGRDLQGGIAVNLIDSEAPQDVYSKVLQVVKRKIQEDSEISPDEESRERQIQRANALKIRDVINRKVIKQTVMTSVYGVTSIGARQQIEGRLYEVFNKQPALVTDEEEDELYKLAMYVSYLTMSSLREVFENARRIMDWLTLVALLVAKEGQGMSWITPLGLPVSQPYRAFRAQSVRTVLQSVILTSASDDLPIAAKKQRTAFPPNFVHSLDATHMLLTALKMKEHGLHFAPVHDSFWTHAADVDIMRKLIRESFVDLYEQPILENLRDSVAMRFPNIDLPPIPTRGDLDIKAVLDSKYFFH